MSVPRLTLPRALGAATLVAGTLLGAGGAQAQVFFETWSERFTVPLYEPAPRYRFERERRLHPSVIVHELEDRGFRNLVVVARRADVYVIEGVSPRTGPVRLVVDAYDGEILQRDAIRRSDAGVVGEDRQTGLSSQGLSSQGFAPSSVATLPTPPVRRAPVLAEPIAPKSEAQKAEPPKVAGPIPEASAAPVRPTPPVAAPALPATRPPSADWNPINSVPVAPLL